MVLPPRLSRVVNKPVLLFGLVLIVALEVVSWGAPRWGEHQLIRHAAPIQAMLEKYRGEHGRYPESLGLIGIVEREEGPLYYQRESESSYMMWLGTALGESCVFYSDKREWR